MFTMHLLAIGNVTTAMQQAMLFNFHSTVQFVPLIFVLHVLKLRKKLWPINIHFYSGKQTGNFMRTKEDIGNVKCAKKWALQKHVHTTAARVQTSIFAAVVLSLNNIQFMFISLN